MKWYLLVLYSFLGSVLALLLAAGLVWWWLTTPLGPHLPIPALPTDYQGYWNYVQVFGIVALTEGALIVLLLGAILYRACNPVR